MSIRTFTPRCALTGTVLADVSGPVFLLHGFPLIVHRPIGQRGKPSGWQVSEPMTGLFVGRVGSSQAAARWAAADIVDRMGGAGALAYAIAHPLRPVDAREATVTGARLSPRVLHAPEFQFDAGGPLDAPEHLPTGGTSQYGTQLCARQSSF